MADEVPPEPPPSSALPALPIQRGARNVTIALVVSLVLAGVVWGASVALAPKSAHEGSSTMPKVHRAAASTCGASVPTRGRDPQLEGCKSDTECTEGKNGRCERDMVGHAHFVNRCRYDDCST